VNLLPPSIRAARAEKAKIPFVAAAGVALVAGLVLVMLGIDNDTAALVAQRDAVSAKAQELAGFEKKVKAADERLQGDLASAETFRALVACRASAAQRLAAVRSALAPWMWLEKWEPGRITVRYWKDAAKPSPGKTPGELVVDKLKGKPAVIDPASVKISDMSAIGKNAQVAQFTVELKFK
jgi:hypothetical protein